MQVHRQLEPSLSGGACSASRTVLIKLTLLSCCMWVRSMLSKTGIHRHARILCTYRYSSYKCMQKLGLQPARDMSVHADTCMMTYMHFGYMSAFVHACASSSHVFTCAGHGSFLSLSLSLFFIEWEKAVSNFLLSAAGRCFSAVNCNLFQLCVLIIAHS